MTDIEATVQRLAKLKAKIAALEMEKKDLEASVKKVVRPGSKLVLRNGYTVSVSKESWHQRLAASDLKAAHPDIYERFTTEVYVSPRVTITAPKKEA